MSLGLEIVIRRISDSPDSAEYEFMVPVGFGGIVFRNATGAQGRARIVKASGDVQLLQPCADDLDGTLFGRVANKLRRH
ncbi:MAG: hypothetical protein QM778_22115 [Myxococcales bacterium]